MKKIGLTLIAAFILSAFSYAQKATVGFQAGFSFSTATVKCGTNKLNTKPLAGFNTGAVLDLQLSDHLTLQTGLNYVQKGYNYKSDNLRSEENGTMRLHYLELPVNFVYYNQPKQNGFFAGGGLSLGFALGGKLSYSSGGQEVEEKVEIGVNENELRGGDMGVNLMTGYAWTNGLTTGFYANLGLSNLSNLSDTQIRNTCFGIKVGYMFR